MYQVLSLLFFSNPFPVRGIEPLSRRPFFADSNKISSSLSESECIKVPLLLISSVTQMLNLICNVSTRENSPPSSIVSVVFSLLYFDFVLIFTIFFLQLDMQQQIMSRRAAEPETSQT